MTSFKKEIFGHISDGPHTTLSPETLEKVLREQNLDKSLISEIINTINAQRSVSYNEGWEDAKELYKCTE